MDVCTILNSPQKLHETTKALASFYIYNNICEFWTPTPRKKGLKTVSDFGSLCKIVSLGEKSNITVGVKHILNGESFRTEH